MTPTSRKTAPQPHKPWWAALFSRITRDRVLFVSGLGLIFNEAVLHHDTAEPSLLVLYAGMVGLPFVFKGDELRDKLTGRGEDR